MHDIALIAANVFAQHEGTPQQQPPIADPNQVAEFERLMNAAPSAEGATDRYVPAMESPLETLSSKVMNIGGDIAQSFRTEMNGFDAQLGAVDMSSPEAMLAVTQLQMHAFGTLYQVQLATGLASQVNRGFQTLLHVQS